jgi:hypothetical protein
MLKLVVNNPAVMVATDDEARPGSGREVSGKRAAPPWGMRLFTLYALIAMLIALAVDWMLVFEGGL